MKLKNKKTGEVITLIDHIFDNYSSLDEFTEDWEEVKPEGPLIKDEKIRKAVRAWAEANNIKAVYYYPEGDGFYVNNFDDEIVASIHFGDKPIEDGYGDQYTIDELCGEEE